MPPRKNTNDQIIDLVTTKLDGIRDGVIDLKGQVTTLTNNVAGLSERVTRIETQQKAQDTAGAQQLQRLDGDLRALREDFDELKDGLAAESKTTAEERGKSKVSTAVLAAVGLLAAGIIADVITHWVTRAPPEPTAVSHVVKP